MIPQTMFVVVPMLVKAVEAFYSEHPTREAAMARGDALRRIACFLATGRHLPEESLGWSPTQAGWRFGDMLVQQAWTSSDGAWVVLQVVPISVLN